MNAQIQITANGINQTVSQKVGKDEVVSTINQSAEEINLSSNRLVVNSTKFKLTKEGDLTCSNANITGGNLNISATYSTPKIQTSGTGRYGYQNSSKIYPDGIRIFNSSGNEMGAFAVGEADGYAETYLTVKNEYSSRYRAEITPDYIYVGGAGSGTHISSSSVETPVLYQTSLAEQKKNFEKFENALKIIDSIDIYKYNLKSENDEQKKHIGFVIGKNYNYSKEITAVNKEGKEIGVDLYSMTSLCLQAIKEQQEIIEQLKQEINSLKESEK
jgi:hypothetical protein